MLVFAVFSFHISFHNKSFQAAHQNHTWYKVIQETFKLVIKSVTGNPYSGDQFTEQNLSLAPMTDPTCYFLQE